MSIEIKKNVYWVGKIDWDLRRFHGEELSTNNGSTYNSYLIKDEKNVLIDTVYTPFAEEFIENLQKLIPLEEIDYIVINHAEPDHSGALPYLMAKIPNAKIFCSPNGVKSIKGYYHKDWDITPMKTGDRLNIGSKELIFIENQFVHWPDSAMCYLTEDKILFSQDAFGQHYANKGMFNSSCDPCVLQFELLKYYANIVAPYSKRVIKKIQELKTLNLDIDVICPSHGVMWDENPQQVVDLYAQWCDSYAEDQVCIVYDTMYQSTRKMAEAIASGYSKVAPKTVVKLFNAGTADKSDIITEIFRSKLIVAGSPTVNNGISTSMAGLLDELIAFAMTGKKATAFGSYGWNPVGLKIINSKLKDAGFEVIADGLLTNWNPDEEALEACQDYGKKLAESMKL